MSGYVDKAMNSINGLGTWEWFGVLIVVVAVGVFCMKGFGSRNGY